MIITICEFKGNFLGNSDGEGIDLEKSIANYQTQVEARIERIEPGTSVAWDFRNGEGDPDRYFSAEGFDDEDSIQGDVNHIREQVFAEGTFWAFTN